MRNITNKLSGGFHEVWFIFMELFYSFLILNLSLKCDYGLIAFIFLPIIVYRFVKMAKRTTTIKYEEAVHQLEEIVHKMENDELDIDSLTDQLEKAKKLIKLCKDKLMKTDDEIHQILDKDEF